MPSILTNALPKTDTTTTDDPILSCSVNGSDAIDTDTNLDTQDGYYLPPTQIITPDDTVNILQLTDLHLESIPNNRGKHTTTEFASDTTAMTHYQSFIRCLDQALGEEKRCDLILLTGDLVNQVKPEIYDHIYQLLAKTKIPFACISGNHDVTDEVGLELPYEQRRYVAHQPDRRLLSRYCIQLNGWRLLLLDTSVPGKVFGKVDDKNLQWLHENLSNSHHPVIITMHHHVLPINSAWMDEHITQDAERFWELISKYPTVKAIINGHIHQFYEGKYEEVSVFATPSTCYQFMSNSDTFKVDEQAQPGYRWLTLQNNDTITSSVHRLSTNH